MLVLLHLQQFFFQRQVRYPPYGPWEHVLAHVWVAPTQEDNDEEGVVGGNGDVCVLCCTKSDPKGMSMCDKCQLQYCTDCIDTHMTMLQCFNFATMSCCAHKLLILTLYLVEK